jgi:fatty acid desaturase
MERAQDERAIDILAAREILPNGSPPPLRPGLYWTDLLASAGIGAASFGLATTLPHASWACPTLTLVAILAWLRALVFLHEIAHRAREIPGFELAWSLLVGLPMGIPSLMYVGSHPDHHRFDRYGTAVDPEYAPLARWGAPRKLLFVALPLLAPLLLVLRWGLLAPLSLVAPGLRSAVVGRCSTLSINPGYVRAAPRAGERRRWVFGEAAACAFVWGVAAAALLDLVLSRSVLHWLLLVSGVFLVNQVRTVLAHRYTGHGVAFDERGQLVDSLTLPERSWLAALIAPLGLRYHALHHGAPGIPYHTLGRVHRRLVASSAGREPYLETLTFSLPCALRAQLRSDPGRASAAVARVSCPRRSA